MEDLSSLKDDLIAAYDRQASERDRSERQAWKIEERDKFLNFIRAHSYQSLLEIGSGPGHDAKFFQNEGLEVNCVDMSPNMIVLCKAKGLNAQVMDFSHLTFADNSFDALWALNCLLHIPKSELRTVLSGIQRVLKPGGLFYMGVYGGRNSEGVREDDRCEPKRFFSFFTDERLKQVLAEFFTIVSFNTLPHSDVLNFQSVVMKNG
ncbi:class I SAM-dependent methyltransferase [Alicyclobacillus sp. SO9]|uniref:class I SAM-dependent methyltransferase n=1 Tax=Alicyclobacillus sp. SO9 TaxID=2665646 RepID=UPI0018E859D8|nr:class I SAM-dependent methyltransferase [Alicyclobacillus sp. SO9]QQE80577.1 class I SAM-dependent methyltransferase [Alicyclobacillus sp. SO9]